MKQVIQDFRSGRLSVAEVPHPALAAGFVLVQNQFSLISSGTERATLQTAQASLIGKARQRPDLVRQVLDGVHKDGFAETLKKVRAKLDTLKELGYSSAGTVLASLDSQGRFRPGDRVACGGGGYASHAGVIAVPENLVAKVPEAVALEAAAFTTLGAIALQGVRQANPRLGEMVCVIGLGLLGQLTAQILRANGCYVFGIDTRQPMTDLASRLGCHVTKTRTDEGLDAALTAFTAGRGFDSVIITASAPSADPIELATAILRQKGVLVVVGAVPMNIPREPHFYRKELELKISCSYGPGRYDVQYEEQGRDYPYGYVRWTENRNMEAFLRLLQSGSLDVQPLITHVFPVEEAVRAYDLVTGKLQEPHLAILLRYAEEPAPAPVAPPRPRAASSAPLIGFIGAGSFAQKLLIPSARRGGQLAAVVTTRGVTAKNVCDKFGFQSCGTDAELILGNTAVNTVFIATRHDTHAGFAAAALRAGKHVFVEKPLALCEEDLDDVLEAARSSNRVLMVGYNRRFSPLARRAREIFQGLGGAVLIQYRVNAGAIPREHWIQTEEGGGRILGEVCHFVDLLQFLTASDPVSVYAVALSAGNAQMPDQDNVVISLRFRDGSAGEITYVACGDKALDKERIEIFGGEQVFVLDDFRTGQHYARGARRLLKLPGKGHEQEVQAFLHATQAGAAYPIDLGSLELTSRTCFAILDSLRTGLPQPVQLPARASA